MWQVQDIDPALAGKTIDELLLVPGFAAYSGPAYGPIVDLQVNGNRIGSLNLDFGLSSLYNASELEQKIEEVVILANALRIAGTDGANLRPRESPDFEVEVPSEATLFAEVTSITPPCPDSYPLVRSQMLIRIDSNPELRAAIDGWAIAITLRHSASWTTPPLSSADKCPGDHLTKNEAWRMVKEVEAFLLSRDFTSYEQGKNVAIPFKPGSLLSKFGAIATVRQGRAGAAPFNIVTSSWVTQPASLEALVQKRFEEKTRVNYLEKPEWLVIGVLEHTEDFALDLGSGPQLPKPFRRVLVLFRGELYQWAGG